MNVVGTSIAASACSQESSSCDRSTRYWIVSCRTLRPSPCEKIATSAWISGSSAPRGGEYVAWPMPTASCSGVACGERGGARLRVEHDALRLGQVRHRQEDVGVREEEVLEVHPRFAAGGVDHRDAGATVVREHDHRLEAEHVGHVVLEHLGVAHEAVAPAEWLVGEAEAREVHRADAIAVAQQLRDLEPVDAARRKAVDQHERRRVGVTELDVEDLHLGRISAARTPREVAALVTPRVCTVHGGDYVLPRARRARDATPGTILCANVGTSEMQRGAG